MNWICRTAFVSPLFHSTIRDAVKEIGKRILQDSDTCSLTAIHRKGERLLKNLEPPDTPAFVGPQEYLDFVMDRLLYLWLREEPEGSSCMSTENAPPAVLKIMRDSGDNDLKINGLECLIFLVELDPFLWAVVGLYNGKDTIVNTIEQLQLCEVHQGPDISKITSQAIRMIIDKVKGAGRLKSVIRLSENPGLAKQIFLILVEEKKATDEIAGSAANPRLAAKLACSI